MEVFFDLSHYWVSIRNFMLEEKYTNAIRESGVLLEVLLKEIILSYSRQLPFQSRKAINELEAKIGGPKKGIESFELGPLIQILMAKNINFMKEVSILVNKDHSIITSINFGYLKSLRNKYVHNISYASRAEAQYFVACLEILLSFFDIEIYNPKALIEEIDKLKTENKLLTSEKGKILSINGYVPFYKKYQELLTNIEYRDTCYYDETDPFMVSIPNFKTLYEKVHYSSPRTIKTRIVINISNSGILPWLLLYRFVRDFDSINKEHIQYRSFFCTSYKYRAVSLMHSVLLYNSSDIEYGYILMSQFGNDKERRHRNLVIQNRAMFRFMLDSYSDLFNSCKKIDSAEFKNLFMRVYNKPKTIDQLVEIITDYYKSISDSKKDAESAIAVWRVVFDI